MEKFLSISELTFLLNKILEETFCQISFEGEIHEISRAASGHIYLTLKDKNSQLSAAMWRSFASRLSFRPEVGMFVQCIGTANLYSKSGRFQMILESMQPAGAGRLQQEFLELKAKLEKEGLFSEARKRELPILPSVVGIVTSESGAALQDMLVKIRERWPSTQVILAPAKVQGEGSVVDICKAIEKLNSDARSEVIIVGRGGGSLEDLWSFNTEAVVRAIFKSSIPIISAVGHETDITLSDLVADVRAPTPTAAAEMVVPHRDVIAKSLDSLAKRLTQYERWFAPMQQCFDDSKERFIRVYKLLIQHNRLRLESSSIKLSKIEPKNLFSFNYSKLQELERRLKFAFGVTELKLRDEKLIELWQRLKKSMTQRVLFANQKLDSYDRNLKALSYQRVLDRGFSLIYSNGKLVKDANALKIGEDLELKFSKASALAEVKKIN